VKYSVIAAQENPAIDLLFQSAPPGMYDRYTCHTVLPGTSWSPRKHRQKRTSNRQRACIQTLSRIGDR